MLTTLRELADQPAHHVCIVGAGPVGLATALACEDAGLSVLLLESGEAAPDAFSAALTAGHSVDPTRHAAPAVAICRALGGTSRWWGGRCVPFDEIDFMARPHVADAAWPIPHDEIRKHYPEASRFFGIGPPRFEMPPASTPPLGDVSFDRLERWTPQVDAGARHRERLEASPRITVVLGATVVDMALDAAGRRVTGLTVAGRQGRVEISPPTVVLACGGIETPRLMLAVQRSRPAAFGGVDGPLGRYYMGHASGKIADLVLSDPSAVVDHDFFLDEGVFVRRRFQLTSATQLREGVLNVAFWADNPPFHAADHRSGILSLVWLALAVPLVGRLLLSEAVRLAHVGPSPRSWGRHAWNVVRSPWATAAGIMAILQARFLSRPRKPGFLVRNEGGRYALHFHAEQAPSAQSRVVLSRRLDPLGLPFLDIDLRFSEADAESIVRSHEVLDAALRQAGAGKLDYYQSSRADRLQSVLAQACDGFHQAGTVRMSRAPAEGVVDRDCAVHGMDNLFVAGCAVLPTSGQANPTFDATALGIRLAGHLAELGRASPARIIERAGLG